MGKDLKGKELGKGIVQEKNGLYLARFTDRFGKRQGKHFVKLQGARKWIADSTYLDEHCDLSIPSEMTVDAWYDYWIEIKQKTVRYNTCRNYSERYKKNIKSIIGHMILKDVKPIHCQQIMNVMADEGYSSSTIYQTRIALYNMFEYAKESDIIICNPCKKSVKSDIGKPVKKKEALTIEIQRKFLEFSKENSYNDQFRFVLLTGLRTGELAALQWPDISFEERTIKIQRSMEFRYSVGEWRIGPPKSKSGYRTIPLTNEAIEILKRQKEKHKSIKVIPIEWKEFVFLCKKGTPIKNSTYDTALFKVCDKAEIPRFSMHVLRHTFATRCIEGGMKPKSLQALMGHSNLSMTMNRYVHTTKDELFKEMNLVEDSLMAV